MRTSEEVSVRSVARNFEIVHALLATDGACISELSERLDIPLSTLHDHLSTLEQLDYVVKRDQEYVPGIRFLDIGGQVRENYKIYRVAKPKIDQLADETGDHANLMIEEHGMGTLLYNVVGQDGIQLDTYTGMQMNLHAVSMGKAILAHLPESRVEQIIDYRGLEPATENTITDREALWEELERIRERGYATDSEERVEGVSCVSAPVLDQENRALGAISISAPSQKIQGKLENEHITERVRRTANAIEINLNFS